MGSEAAGLPSDGSGHVPLSFPSQRHRHPESGDDLCLPAHTEASSLQAQLQGCRGSSVPADPETNFHRQVWSGVTPWSVTHLRMEHGPHLRHGAASMVSRPSSVHVLSRGQ